MNRLDIVHKIAEEFDLPVTTSARILNTVTESIKTAVKKGDPVGIVGFGTFRQLTRAPRKGHNPKTGEKLKIPARKVIKFVPGLPFRDLVDPKAAARRTEAAKPVRKAAKRGGRKSA